MAESEMTASTRALAAAVERAGEGLYLMARAPAEVRGAAVERAGEGEKLGGESLPQWQTLPRECSSI